jgi:hypothetical protein
MTETYESTLRKMVEEAEAAASGDYISEEEFNELMDECKMRG